MRLGSLVVVVTYVTPVSSSGPLAREFPYAAHSTLQRPKKKDWDLTCILTFLSFFLFFFCLFVLFRAASAAYGGPQARGLI